MPQPERFLAHALPAFSIGRPFLYPGAFTHPIGLYPPVHRPPELVAALAGWRQREGSSLAFRHDQPAPLTLIGAIATALATQYRRR